MHAVLLAIVDGSLEVRIADLGLARLVQAGDGTMTQTHGGGTRGYMAPEVPSGRFGPKADMYSLGVSMFDMAVGRKPGSPPSFPDFEAEDPCAPLQPSDGGSDEAAKIYELLVFTLHSRSADRPSAAELLARMGHRDHNTPGV